MSEYVTLLGAEGIRTAGSRIEQAELDRLKGLLVRWRDKHSCVYGDPPAYRCDLCRDTDNALEGKP